MAHNSPILSVRISPLLLARVQFDAAAANLTVSQHTRARLSNGTVRAVVNPLLLHDLSQLILALQREGLQEHAAFVRRIADECKAAS